MIGGLWFDAAFAFLDEKKNDNDGTKALNIFNNHGTGLWMGKQKFLFWVIRRL